MASSFQSAAPGDRLTYARTSDGRTWQHRLWHVRRMLFCLHGERAEELPEFEHAEAVRDVSGRIVTGVAPRKPEEGKWLSETVWQSGNGNVTRFARAEEGAIWADRRTPEEEPVAAATTSTPAMVPVSAPATTPTPTNSSSPNQRRPKQKVWWLNDFEDSTAPTRSEPAKAWTRPKQKVWWLEDFNQETTATPIQKPSQKKPKQKVWWMDNFQGNGEGSSSRAVEEGEEGEEDSGEPSPSSSKTKYPVERVWFCAD